MTGDASFNSDGTEETVNSNRQYDELTRWPYAVHSVENTLNLELIEGRGKQILFHALSNKSAVAFLGSGISQAYGRISWGEWLERQMDGVIRLAKKHVSAMDASLALIQKTNVLLECLIGKDEADPVQLEGLKDPEKPGKPLKSEMLENYKAGGKATIVKSKAETVRRFLDNKKTEIKYRRDEVEKLQKTVSALRSDGGGSGGDHIPVAFQAVEHLVKTLNELDNLLIDERWRGVRQELASSSNIEEDIENLKNSIEGETPFGFAINARNAAGPKEHILELRKLLSVLTRNLDATPEDKVHYKPLEDFWNSQITFHKALKDLVDIASNQESRLSFTEMVKVLFIDECVHAESIVWKATDYSLESGREKWHNRKERTKAAVDALPKRSKERKTKEEERQKELECNALIRGGRPGTTTDNLRRDIQGIKRLPQRYWSLGYFTSAGFGDLCKETEDYVQARCETQSWIKFVGRINELRKQNVDRTYGPDISADRHFISPSHRYLFAVFASLFEDPYRDLEGWASLPHERGASPEEASTGGIFRTVKAEHFKARTSIMDLEVDTMDKLVRKLNLRQFLTTNYDLEVERYFDDHGYSNIADDKLEPNKMSSIVRKSHRDEPRHDGTGGLFRDQSFHRDRAVDLVSFALDQDGADAQVFHMHGRATKESPLIVTERDYMNMYIRADEHRDAVNESIKTAFSASPLVFFGLGMNEADVLRPLRQFMSDQDRAFGKTSVVFYPVTGDINSRTKTAATLYLRYGTHTVFYGSGIIRLHGIRLSDSSPRETLPVRFDWLYHADRLNKELLSVNKKILDILILAYKKLKQNNQPEEAVHKLSKDDERKVNELLMSHRPNTGRDFLKLKDVQRLDHFAQLLGDCHVQICKTGKPLIVQALAALCGRTELCRDPDRELDRRHLYFRMKRCHFETANRDSEVLENLRTQAKEDPILSVDYEILSSMLRMCCSEPIGGQKSVPTWNSLFEILATDGNVSRLDELSLLFSIRQVRARILAHDAVKSSLISGVFSASLDGLEEEWQSWLKNWRRSPPHRIAKFSTKPSVKLDDAHLLLPTRYIRHEMDNTLTTLQRAEDTGPSLEPNTGVATFDTFLKSAKARLESDLKKLEADRKKLEAEIKELESDPARSASELKELESGMRKNAPGFDIGRRFFVVLADRGLGKGTFFSAFSTRNGVASFISALWPHRKFSYPTSQKAKAWNAEIHSAAGNHIDPHYTGAIFINLSFSTEVSSAFDMLIDALQTECAKLKAFEVRREHWLIDSPLPASLARIQDIFETTRERKEWDEFVIARDYNDRNKGEFAAAVSEWVSKYQEMFTGLSRIRKIRSLLSLYKSLSTKIQGIKKDGSNLQPRLILCFNAVELLNYRGGLFKNREVQEILYDLTSSIMKDYPFDLVLVGSEENLPPMLTKKTPFADRYRSAIAQLPDHLRSTNPYGEPDGGDNFEPSRWKRDNVVAVTITRAEIGQAGIQNIARREERTGIKFLAKTKAKSPEEYGAEFVPLPKGSSPKDVYYLHFLKPFEPAELLVDNFLPLAFLLHWQFFRKPKETAEGEDKAWFQDHFVALNKDLEQAQQMSFLRLDTEAVKEAWAREHVEGAKNQYAQIKKTNDDAIKARIEAAGPFRKPKSAVTDGKPIWRARLLERFDVDQPSKALWQRLRAVLGNNRYAMTLLMATAQRVAMSGQNFKEAATQASRFLDKVLENAGTVSIERREDSILHDVFTVYETFHVAGRARDDVQLHLLLIRHLAIVGAPCSVDVLVRVPEILEYLNADADPKNQVKSRVAYLTEALTVLADRGLIFRLKEHPRLSHIASDRVEKVRGARKGSAALEKKQQDAAISKYFGPKETDIRFRYSLHRLMQRYFLRKMGSGPREFVEINSFAPSLYASMPAELPLPTLENYAFLNRLVTSLSQYPDQGPDEKRVDPWHFGNAPHPTQVQALRAALSIVRSTFSIAVVSRFEDLVSDHTDNEIPLRGYFEAHRVKVRWIIRKAWELHKLVDETPPPYDPSREDWTPSHINALYRDEIVWLHNECGLICLVQGNLPDAVALLRQAIHLNRNIEGDHDGGAHYNRISLNLAIAQIERGRIDSARKRLEHICESEERNNPFEGRIWHLAHGYLGLINQLTGNADAARKHYQRAVTVLRAYEDLRACAVFSKHWGDLESAQHDPARAETLLHDAVGFAQAGGHEDLHKKILLSQIHLDLAGHKEHEAPNAELMFKKIRIIEDYARTMQMPALICEAATARAELLMRQGEISLAGDILSKAMAMAKRYGMLLRLNTAMTNYARVLAKRGLVAQANRLLSTCLEMAKRNKNQLEIARVEAVYAELDWTL